MLSILKNWGEMPQSVKNAIIALFAGWAATYLFYFSVIFDGQSERVTYLLLGVGLGICYCVATIRVWARRLCIFFNIAMVVTFAWAAGIFAWTAFVYDQTDKLGLFGLTAFIAAAFAFSLYSLLKKDTARYFSPPEKDTQQEN